MPRKHLKGTSYYKGKWIARSRVNGKYTYLGYFATAEEAHEAYLKAQRGQKYIPRKSVQRTAGIPPKTPPGVVAIPLTQGHWAFVDEADAPLVQQYSWYANDNGSYVMAYTRKEGISMHRMLAKPNRTQCVLHKDDNRLNNCRSNLVVTTRGGVQRSRRKRADSGSKYKGVRKDGSRWIARLSCKGQRIHLGSYLTELEAAQAYDRAARKYFRDRGRQNLLHSKPEP